MPALFRFRSKREPGDPHLSPATDALAPLVGREGRNVSPENDLFLSGIGSCWQKFGYQIVTNFAFLKYLKYCAFKNKIMVD